MSKDSAAGPGIYWLQLGLHISFNFQTVNEGEKKNQASMSQKFDLKEKKQTLFGSFFGQCWKKCKPQIYSYIKHCQAPWCAFQTIFKTSIQWKQCIQIHKNEKGLTSVCLLTMCYLNISSSHCSEFLCVCAAIFVFHLGPCVCSVGKTFCVKPWAGFKSS